MPATAQKAVLYRMVMDKHLCPYGLKAKDLLERQGFVVEDHWLTTREETDRFKAEHDVKSTPQTFIDSERVGGYETCAVASARWRTTRTRRPTRRSSRCSP